MKSTAATNADDRSIKSTFYEQLVEHVFVSEVLQEVWYRFKTTAEVRRSEIDAMGYDVVVECNGIVRYVQLKTSRADAKTAYQKVNTALAQKPGGCVVWLMRHEDRRDCRVELEYRFFGGGLGEKLPDLGGFKMAKHTKANAQGVKAVRPGIRVVPKSSFEPPTDIKGLIERLFGLKAPASDIRPE